MYTYGKVTYGRALVTENGETSTAEHRSWFSNK